MSPADEARAFELVRVNGLSYAAAGKQLGGLPKTTVRAAVTREAVRRARVDAGHAPEPVPEAGFMAAALGGAPVPDRLHLAPPRDEDEDDELEVDAETIIRRQIKKVANTIEELNAERMFGEAQKYTRTLAGLSHDLRQIEKAKRDDNGVMTFTLEDVAKAEAELDKMAHDIAHRGFVCAECGRKMRRAEAEGTQ